MAAAAFAALSYRFVHAFPYGLMYDDGYFYAQIAYNLGHLGASTFDGVNTTSGYHLVWAGLLGTVSTLLHLVTPSKAVHLFAFQCMFAWLALVTARFSGRGVFGALAVFILILMGTLLMETLLLSLLLLVFLEMNTRDGTHATRDRWVALAIAFVVPLVRIDATVILLIYAALVFIEGKRQDSVRVMAALALGALTQLATMYWIFGHVFSVSAEIKASSLSSAGDAVLASLVGPEGFVLGYAVRSLLFVALLGPAVALCLANRHDPATRKHLYVVLGAAAFTAGHIVTHLIPFWCYLPSYLVSFHVISRCAVSTPSLAAIKRLTVVSVVLLGVLFLGHKVRIHFTNLEIVEGAREFVDQLKDHVPATERIYQIDGSGFTGYFSERSVVNGDGLVNSYEYADRLAANSLAGVLDEQRICYIVTNRAPTGDDIIALGGLVVSREEVVEVFRSRTYGSYPTTDFILYRRDTAGCETTP
jgi:hypothetical protein